MAGFVVTPATGSVTATIADAVTTASPGTPQSTDISVSQTAGDVPVVPTAVAVVHTASEPVVMRGGSPEITTSTEQPGFALSTTANIWLCIMLLMAYYFI